MIIEHNVSCLFMPVFIYKKYTDTTGFHKVKFFANASVTLPIFGLASRRVFKFKNSCYQ